jgi:hypothetical protein
MVTVFLLLASAVYVFKSCRDLPGDVMTRTGEAVRNASQAWSQVAAAFRQGTVVTSFVSYATAVSNQQHFQFATLRQHEVFTRTEVPSTGFGYVPLPDVVVEARAPVEYTYYLDFNAPWRFVLKNQVIYVVAPQIRFNKPAVDASLITYEVRKGYFKTAEATEKLKLSITSLVTLRAKDNIHLVRENGRRQTEEFVQKWLARSFTDGQAYVVKVYFADEKLPEDVELAPSTLP